VEKCNLPRRRRAAEQTETSLAGHRGTEITEEQREHRNYTFFLFFKARTAQSRSKKINKGAVAQRCFRLLRVSASPRQIAALPISPVTRAEFGTRDLQDASSIRR
jgi:hypothetical protein